jgi:hypothetical protein
MASMNPDDSIGTRLGQIMEESARLGRAAWSTVLLYIAVLTGVGAVIDQMDDVSAANLGFTVVSFGLGFLLTVNLLRSGGFALAQRGGGFGSYFGLSLVGGLAMLLGLVLLVIPGAVLFVRWAPAYGYALCEGPGTRRRRISGRWRWRSCCPSCAIWVRLRFMFWEVTMRV